MEERIQSAEERLQAAEKQLQPMKSAESHRSREAKPAAKHKELVRALKDAKMDRKVLEGQVDRWMKESNQSSAERRRLEQELDRLCAAPRTMEFRTKGLEEHLSRFEGIKTEADKSLAESRPLLAMDDAGHISRVI